MSVQDLLDFGMVKNDDDPFFPYSKDLSAEKELSEDEEIDDLDNGKIELAVYMGRNQHDFVLALPDGLVFLGIKSVEDLKTIEKLILEYEPNF